MPHYEEGLYRGKIIGQALVEGEKKTDGSETNPSFQLVVMPIGYYDSDRAFHAHDFMWERTIYIPLTENTIGKDKPGWALETIRHLGFTGDSFAQLDPDADNGCNLLDKEIDCLCRLETYEGKTREKWSVFRPREKKEFTPPAPKVVRSLDTKFSKVLKATAGPKPQVPTTPPAGQPPATPPPSNEQLTPAGGPPEADIPF